MNALLPPIVTGTPPWVTRVAEVKSRAAANVDAERRVVQLNDEIQALVRNLKSKDQNIQESSVKIELMERRMETVKKQADAINDLEAELSKARKQERSYEEAIDQLQHDLDALEQDNIKLKTLANNPERQGLESYFHHLYPSLIVTDVYSFCGSTHRHGNITSGRKRRNILPTGASW